MIASEIGHGTPDSITIRGLDLACDVIGRLDLVEAFVLSAIGRLPTSAEKATINALLVVSLDHGLTPAAIAARLTYLGAPDSFSGAVAAGLLGAGSRYLGPSMRVAEQFTEWTAGLEADASAQTFDATALKVLQDCSASGRKLAGYGHPIHKQGDPRVPALRRVAFDNGFRGAAWKLADAIAKAMEQQGHRLPMNAACAVGVTILDMKMEPTFAIALTLIGRCAGLAAHLMEERSHPIAQEVWELVATQDARVDFGKKQGGQGEGHRR